MHEVWLCAGLSLVGWNVPHGQQIINNGRSVHQPVGVCEDVLENFLPLVEKPETEGQLRELSALRIDGTYDYDAEAQRAVWQIAFDPHAHGRDVAAVGVLENLAQFVLKPEGQLRELTKLRIDGTHDYDHASTYSDT